jgi:hypothetical protein
MRNEARCYWAPGPGCVTTRVLQGLMIYGSDQGQIRWGTRVSGALRYRGTQDIMWRGRMDVSM